MLTTINIILVVILLGMGTYELSLFITRKRSAQYLEQEKFNEGMRKAQVIDVREKDMFRAGHIMGARNLPYTTGIRTGVGIEGLRKDQPIYLYDQKKVASIRAASKLRKAGYQDIYILKGGYDSWTGKIKKKEIA